MVSSNLASCHLTKYTLFLCFLLEYLLAKYIFVDVFFFNPQAFANSFKTLPFLQLLFVHCHMVHLIVLSV
jgi:hypothetical protein